MKSIFERFALVFAVVSMSLFVLTSCEGDLVSKNAKELYSVEDAYYYEEDGTSSIFFVRVNDIYTNSTINLTFKDVSGMSFPSGEYFAIAKEEDMQKGEVAFVVHTEDGESYCGVSGKVRITGDDKEARMEISVVTERNTVEEYVYDGPIAFVYDDDIE